jgi:hypothetical protein
MLETPSFRSLNDVHVPVSKPSLTTSTEHPYICMPYLSRTIPELLGTADQFRANDLDEGPAVEFGPAVTEYNRRYGASNFQWLSMGRCGGDRISSDRPLFSNRDVMTETDAFNVARAIVDEELFTLWR